MPLTKLLYLQASVYTATNKTNRFRALVIKLLSKGKRKPQKPSVSKAFGVRLIIPTRSCQKFSKQICLWDLVQGIGIIFIIQIVEAI